MSPTIALPSQLAVVLHGPRDIRLESRPLWPPQRDHVQVAVQSTGLCGSDLHYYLHARNGDFAVQSPLVLGHESTGVVTAVGPGVYGVSIGQRVAIEPGIMCKTCRYCTEGRYNLCKNMRFCSSAKTFPHTDGMLQENINHPASVLHPIPDGLPLSIASLAEPLSVLLHAAGRAGLCVPFTSPSPSKTITPLAKDKTVLVFGVGTIGILACALSKALGARKVCAVDIDTKRLEFALDGGWADAIFCLPRKETPQTMPLKPLPNGVVVNGKVSTPQKPATEDALRKSKQTMEVALEYFKQSEGFDVVFECTGAETCIQMSVFSALPGSKIMLVGMGSSTVPLPVSSAAVREVDILGSFRYAGTWAPAVELLHRSWRLVQQQASYSGLKDGGLGDVGRLITHRFKLHESKKAFELMSRGRDENGGLVLKVLIESS